MSFLCQHCEGVWSSANGHLLGAAAYRNQYFHHLKEMDRNKAMTIFCHRSEWPFCCNPSFPIRNGPLMSYFSEALSHYFLDNSHFCYFYFTSDVNTVAQSIVMLLSQRSHRVLQFSLSNKMGAFLTASGSPRNPIWAIELGL